MTWRRARWLRAQQELCEPTDGTNDEGLNCQRRIFCPACDQPARISTHALSAARRAGSGVGFAFVGRRCFVFFYRAALGRQCPAFSDENVGITRWQIHNVANLHTRQVHSVDMICKFSSYPNEHDQRYLECFGERGGRSAAPAVRAFFGDIATIFLSRRGLAGSRALALKGMSSAG